METFSSGNLKYTIKRDDEVELSGYILDRSIPFRLPSTVKHNRQIYRVTSIKSNAYRGSKFAGKLVIPSSVTEIGNDAFRDCSGFTGSLSIPNGVTEIGKYAFCDCSGLTGSLFKGFNVTVASKNMFPNGFRNCQKTD